MPLGRLPNEKPFQIGLRAQPMTRQFVERAKGVVASSEPMMQEVLEAGMFPIQK